MNSEDLILKAIEDQAESEGLGLLKGSPEWHAQQMAEHLITLDWSDPESKLVGLAREVVAMITAAIAKGDGQRFSNSGKLETLVHLNAGCLALPKTWIKITKECCAIDFKDSVSKNVLQHVIQSIFPRIVGSLEPDVDVIFPENLPTEFSSTERQELCNGMNYIVRKLLGKTKCNEAARLFVYVVGNWICPPDSDEEDYRGGFLNCYAPFYLFMKVVECRVRLLLRPDNLPDYAGRDIMPEIVGKLKSSLRVQESFRALIGYSISDERLCEALLNAVLTSWVCYKANQTIRQYLDMLRQQRKDCIEKMEQPAMH